MFSRKQKLIVPFSLITIFWIAIAFSGITLGQRHRPTLITGSVTDGLGAVVPNANIVVLSRKGQKFQTSSGFDGIYKILLEPGIYSFTIVRAPFSDFKIETYQVAAFRAEMMLDVSLICDGCPINSLKPQE